MKDEDRLKRIEEIWKENDKLNDKINELMEEFAELINLGEGEE